MTAIVAVTDGPRVWIGADSCVTTGATRDRLATPKLWRAGGYVVAGAGCSAWCSLLRRVALPSVASSGYMLSGWVEELLAAARSLALTLPADDGALDGCALVAGAGCVWYVDSCLECYRTHGDAAIGSGADAARGALFVMRGRPRARVLRALEAAASVCNDVEPPFELLSV